MKRSALLLGAAAIAAAYPTQPLLPRQSGSACYDLYMIVARGSNEAPGEGAPGLVADMIQDQIPNSASVAVDYPATIESDGTSYPASVTDGINDTINKIETYVGNCGSDSQIALLGYSQGGNVMTDVLAGGVDKPTPLSDQYRQNIVGVAVFGDPTFTVGQSFDSGNATKSGIFSRGGDSLALLNTYASVLQSYCMVHDFFCATGDSLDTHYAEVSTFAQAATDFIVGLVQ